MNEQNERNRSEGGIREAYIVTEDLSVLVRRWCKRQRPPIPTDELTKSTFFPDLLNALVDALQTYCFDEDDVEVIGLDRSTFDDLLHKRDDPTKPTEFWVSLDDVYPLPERQSATKYNMSITRYVDIDCDTIKLNGHGPRPEYPYMKLHLQVNECVIKLERARRKYGPLRLVLIDDGTFDGDTVTNVLNEFEKHGVSIYSIRLGVAKRKGLEAIADWPFKATKGKSRKLYFIGASKLCPPIKDWICERDFFPGVEYAGKVVATRVGDEVEPLRVGKKGIPVRAQYLHDWGYIVHWATIPEKKTMRFTKEALKLSNRLWERLEDLRNRSLRKAGLKEKGILLEELPAIPLKIYRHYAHNPEGMERALKRRWLDVLREQQD